ncbi:LamG-like jellyroll fold domain-containing protein [Rubinisphaera brasiliensis]|uniref:FecR protein n=1 Tax=Rubinisphaera brasiliensis (strain ATCC 49424 / DSM 5305 / JCM 21570 / IAM 15109 / NBRC 103401 / IFAM 1448) TaxID=756272 RepID=F0SJK0_RUBBR|nr:LamG-like jellyroll fold domain-containing protein [Rubinisphaera brasiliensis]ADY60812.1 FecR protein [Rubinisphaera brasiliensis DSM 5305]
MDQKTRTLIFQAIDQSITLADFERLQDLIETDPEVRQEYLRAVRLCDTLHDIGMEPDRSRHSSDAIKPNGSGVMLRPSSLSSIAQWSAACLAFLVVGATAFWAGQINNVTPEAPVAENPPQPTVPREAHMAGHATLRRAFDVDWEDESSSWREGDILPGGILAFDAGVAEIDFFCGATLIVEGPARLDIQSDWSVTALEGRIRANVPPAARGFIVKAAESEIIDLGTEFAVEVTADNAHVTVLDGEVKLRGGQHNGTHLLTGDGRSLKGERLQPNDWQTLSTSAELEERHRKAQASRFEGWRSFAEQLGNDERLIAYYPIASQAAERTVANTAPSGDSRDGQILGPVGRAAGRFGPESTALEFARPGSRIRTLIDGEFEAYTFACWVRIDSLKHRYNALFMGDGYENGEPHWQIRDDGRVMFSVMVDDTQVIEYFSEEEQGIVVDAGKHRVYSTEPIWESSQSGQWFHLAAVYHPAAREVRQYLNGELLQTWPIKDEFYIETLRIGPAEAGNWGQPFRDSPWFAVRNLDGAIDELMIFNAALTGDEIRSIYNSGRPSGH